MKKVYLATLVVMVAGLIGMPSIAQTNLLKNPGFEIEGYDGANKAESWDIWMGERLNEFPRNGNWSLHSWAFDGEGDGGAWQGITVTPGTKIEFKGYLMSPGEVGVFHKDPLKNGAEAFLEIEWFRGNTKLSSVRSEKVRGATDWKLYSVTGTAPLGADSARLVAKVVSVYGSSGDIYFDDLEAKIISK